MKTTTEKPVKVAVKDLKTNLFVRQRLNEDHVIILAGLVENGVKLPPIMINRDLVIIDGRHRKEAYEILSITEIEAVIVDVGSETEMIAQAFKANTGGSLPPTTEDIEHTIMLLLECGEAKKHIGAMLGLPAGLARKFINSVQSKATRSKLQQAAASVTEGGLTVAKAAEQHGVDPERLKDTLSGHRRKSKKGIPEIQRNITRSFKSLSSKNAALIRSLLEKYEDGDVSERQVREIFEHIEGLQKLSSRTLADWMSRFDALAKKPGAAK